MCLDVTEPMTKPMSTFWTHGGSQQSTCKRTLLLSEAQLGIETENTALKCIFRVLLRPT